MFWPKSSVNPFEKNQCGVYEKSYFYSLGGLVFFLKDLKTLFLGLFCPKTNQDKIFIFWPKSWVNPSEKNPNIATV